MARKTAIHTTNAQVAADEYRRTAAIDRPTSTNRQASRTLLPSLPDWREARDRMTEAELLKIARLAARLELRGANYSADDREDCAADLVRHVLVETDGAMPRRESPRVALTAMCDRAKNVRRGINRLRLRDAADAEQASLAYSMSPAALGIDYGPARHAAIVARSNEAWAETAVAAVLEHLGLPVAEHTADSAVWLVLYQWAIGETSERVADRRGISHSLARKRLMVGAKFLRHFYSPTELVSLLTDGARIAADGTLTYCAADVSREAPHKWADDVSETFRRGVCWREGTAGGEYPERPTDADSAREVCIVTRTRVRPKREREAAKRAEKITVLVNPRTGRTMTYTKTHGTKDMETAEALARIARAHALTAKRERQAARTSAVQGAYNLPAVTA